VSALDSESYEDYLKRRFAQALAAVAGMIPSYMLSTPGFVESKIKDLLEVKVPELTHHPCFCLEVTLRKLEGAGSGVLDRFRSYFDERYRVCATCRVGHHILRLEGRMLMRLYVDRARRRTYYGMVALESVESLQAKYAPLAREQSSERA